MTGGAVRAQVCVVIGAIVGTDLEHVMHLELLRRRELVAMPQADLAPIA
jgi:hypothetical protein